MKKALGIVVLVLALSLVSVPAFAQKAELSLKYWHAGVGGADLWVADYQVADELDYPAHGYYGYDFSKEKLVLQPAMGGSFILSGSYFLSSSTSVAVSYWGLSRADTVGVEFIDEYSYYYDGEYIDDENGPYWRYRSYMLTLPWWEIPWEFYSDRSQWAGNDDFDGKAVLVAEGNLSMSALDIAGTKTLAGSGWEVGLSGGVRRAVFAQDQSTGLELSGGYFDDDIDDIEYVAYSSEKWNLDLDSRLDITAIGPQVGIEGKYALGNKLVLKAGAKAGILFGTATSGATWSVDNWDYEEVEDSYKWVLDEFADVSYTATDSVQISTYDLSASLGYQITEQWSVEAGYYASLWKRVPSVPFFKYDPEETCPGDYPIYYCNFKKGTWEQPEARDIVVSGLTVGVNFKF